MSADTQPLAPAPTRVVVMLEGVLWTPTREWEQALHHLAGRAARLAPLDVDQVLVVEGLAAQLETIDEWAAWAGISIDIDGELARFFDQHLSIHVRPAPSLTRMLRRVATGTEIHLCSALPTAAATSVAHHLGAHRSTTSITGRIRSTTDLDDHADQLAADAAVTTVDELSRLDAAGDASAS